MHTQKPLNSFWRTYWRWLATLVLLGIAALVLLRSQETLRAGFRALGSASGGYIWLAAGLTLATFFLAAAIYCLLALKPLRYQRTVVVELAAASVNRLVPSGLGGLGIHGLYLYKQKHSAAQATVVVSVNNLLGIVAHLLLLIVVCIAVPHSLQLLDYLPNFSVLLAVAVVIVLTALLLVCLPSLRGHVTLFGKNLGRSVRKYAVHPQKISLAFLLALLLTATYTTVLYVSSRALGIELSLVQTFIIFSVGMLVGTATPTPGGLVGAEAGLFAGFVAYGIKTEQALAAALLFRLLAYWLPMLPGLLMLLVARKRHWL